MSKSFSAVFFDMAKYSIATIFVVVAVAASAAMALSKDSTKTNAKVSSLTPTTIVLSGYGI